MLSQAIQHDRRANRSRATLRIAMGPSLWSVRDRHNPLLRMSTSLIYTIPHYQKGATTAEETPGWCDSNMLVSLWETRQRAAGPGGQCCRGAEIEAAQSAGGRMGERMRVHAVHGMTIDVNEQTCCSFSPISPNAASRTVPTDARRPGERARGPRNLRGACG